MKNAKQINKAAYPDSSRGFNNFTHDINLHRYLDRYYSGLLKRQKPTLEDLGAFCSGKLDAQAEYSDRVHPPILKSDLDRTVAPSKRKTEVVLNDQYKECQQDLYRFGVIEKCFDEKKPEPQFMAFMAQYMVSYSDISTGCPGAMLHPIVLTLLKWAPKNVKEMFVSQLLRSDGKTMIGGTWATEWDGGSDVRGNTKTKAVLINEEENLCQVEGRNFFTSATGFDNWAAIKTVEMDGGIALVFIPKYLDMNWDDPEKERILNDIAVSHLKEKSGTRGLATAEVEINGATAYLVAGPKEGMRAMMEALGCSRIHNAMAAAGVMHRAYVEAMCWAENRSTFNNTIKNYDEIQEDLLELKTNWSAGAALAFEAAKSFDDTIADKNKAAWLRVATALAKFRTAEMATECTAMATEVIGGIGYTKDHPIERINRDAMVLRVWEGPKHIQAKDLTYILANGGKEALFERLQEILNVVPDHGMSLERNRLKELRDNLLQALDKNFEPGKKPSSVGVKLMRQVSDVLSYALLCEEAAHELSLYKDISKQLIARTYYDQYLSSRDKFSFEPSPLHKYFNQIASREPISHLRKDEPEPIYTDTPKPK